MTLKASGCLRKKPKLPKLVGCPYCGTKFKPTEDTYELVDNTPLFSCVCGEDFELNQKRKK